MIHITRLDYIGRDGQTFESYDVSIFYSRYYLDLFLQSLRDEHNQYSGRTIWEYQEGFIKSIDDGLPDTLPWCDEVLCTFKDFSKQIK